MTDVSSLKVVNDDGPPSTSSPYIAKFVRMLQQAGHITSVILPSVQNSGMAKAYNFGQTLQPTYYTPDPAEGFHASDRWILVNGTPASCVQLGIYHLFQDRGPVDLVISGPNYGHNLTSAYHLASGTVGGAMEAALCGKKAVSLSFAFGNHEVPGHDGVHKADIIAPASQVSIELIENLAREWQSDVEVYHINIPALGDTVSPQVVWVTAFRGSLSPPGVFQPLDESGVSSPSTSSLPAFMWAPQSTDLKRSFQDGLPGTDVWALKEGYIGFVIQSYIPNKTF